MLGCYHVLHNSQRTLEILRLLLDLKVAEVVAVGLFICNAEEVALDGEYQRY